ncbi:MAG TPA: hypothetical protein VFC19_10690 [Candidatus Limnocylindrales bacterium]|nr:hypothetical protein [Candidatus Limnocylindrales bacterium]
MKISRLPIAVAVAVIALLATSAPAQASFSQIFSATSGDSCRYGATQGTLVWRYSTTAPIVPITVDVRGTAVDRPVPNEWSCRDDGFYSVAIFTAFGSSPVRQDVRANNEAVSFTFTLVAPSTAGLSRLQVQVCRFPLPVTQPPGLGYCGTPQHYAPPVYDPPPPRV